MDNAFNPSDFRNNREKYRLFKTAITKREIEDIPANTVVAIEYVREDLNIQSLGLEPQYRITRYMKGDNPVPNNSNTLVFGSVLGNFVL